MTRQFDFANNPQQPTPRTFNFNAGTAAGTANGAGVLSFVGDSSALCAPVATGPGAFWLDGASIASVCPSSLAAGAFIFSASGSGYASPAAAATANIHFVSSCLAYSSPVASASGDILPSASVIAACVPVADGVARPNPAPASSAACVPLSGADGRLTLSPTGTGYSAPAAFAAAVLGCNAAATASATNGAIGAGVPRFIPASVAAAMPVSQAAGAAILAGDGVAAVCPTAHASAGLALSGTASALSNITLESTGAGVIAFCPVALAAVAPRGKVRVRAGLSPNATGFAAPAAAGNGKILVDRSSLALCVPFAAAAGRARFVPATVGVFKRPYLNTGLLHTSSSTANTAGATMSPMSTAWSLGQGAAHSQQDSGTAANGVRHAAQPAPALVSLVEAQSGMLRGVHGETLSAWQAASGVGVSAAQTRQCATPMWHSYSEPRGAGLGLALIVGQALAAAASLCCPLLLASQAGLSLRRRICHPMQAARPPAFIKITIYPPIKPPEPSPHTIIFIPDRRFYTMRHDISVVRLPDNLPIPVTQVSLSYSADSYAWGFTAELADKAYIPELDTSVNEPVKLKISIDGYEFIMIAETISAGLQFADSQATVQGRSLSALLGDPYVQPYSYTAGSERTNQQLAEDLLPLIGWSIDWQAPTWLVAANAFSFTNQTTLQGLSMLASTGFVLKPSRTAQSFTMQQRYPVAPWFYADVEPDLVVPEAALLSVGMNTKALSPVNAVYVHGGDAGGVVGRVVRGGSAGDVLLPTVQNSLITDEPACRALGERLLAEHAAQPKIASFTMSLGGDFVLVDVGQLVEVTYNGTTERATVSGVSITAGLGSVTQTVMLSDSANNLWRTFTSLLPKQPLLIGTLASTDGNISVLSLLDGGVITARGAGTVGGKYWVRDGLIEGQAPVMGLVEVVV